MQYYDPYGGTAGFAPQGMFGNIFHSIAPTLGGAIGGALGNAGLGRQIGGMAGQIGKRYIPFGADPSFAPQGFFGDLAGALGPAVGGMVGGLAGNPALGQQIGGIAGQLGQQYIPFSNEQQFAPQGFLGNMFGQVAPHLGSAIGGRFGNAALGQQIGNIAGGIGRRFIPFSNEPQYAPQGFFGDLAGALGPAVGGMVGGLAGNPALGQQIGGIAGQLGQQYIPFSNEPQYAPQGFFGNLIGAAAPIAGGIFGGPVGGAVGSGVGALARRYIPFSADPYAQQGWGMA